MADQVLFREPTATRVGPLGYAEPPVRWFSTSTRPQAVASRAAVNAWYADFPDTPKRKLAANLKSSKPVTHYGGLDELYVHHLLRQRYDDVRYEVDGKGPDFRVYEGERCIAAMEVLSLFEPPAWDEPMAQHGRIADRLNKDVKPTAGYFVRFEIIRAPDTPSTKKFTGFIKSELAKLPPPEELQPDQLKVLSRSTYCDGPGTRIEVTFVPMRPDAPSRTNPDARLASPGVVIGGMVMVAYRLKTRLKEKAAARYDIDGIPYAVAVGIHDLSADDEEILAGIYGGTSYLGGRVNTGLFAAAPGTPEGRHRRISAVFVMRALPLWEGAFHDVVMLRNPHAGQAWPQQILPARLLEP